MDLRNVIELPIRDGNAATTIGSYALFGLLNFL